MTPNTSQKKPAWFALTENSAASAQVRKVDKKLPAATAIVALAIVAFGTFFANGSMNFDSSPTSNLASASMSTVTSGDVNQGDVNQGEVAQTNTASSASTAVTQTPTENAQAVKSVKVVAPQSMNGITDPTLNGGGDDDDDDDDDDRD
jgi:hypothetical protein